MGPFEVLVIFLTGFCAGIFGTLTGGAGLITIPALIFLGLSPHLAIGTHFFGVTGMNIAGWYKFHEKGLIDYRIGFIITVPVMFGSILGASLVLKIDESLLRKTIAILTILVLFFITFKSTVGLERTKRRVKKHEYVLAMFLSFLIGVYNGFYSSVSGTFTAYILILIFGQTFLESAATRKIPMTISTLFAAIVFAVSGAISYGVGAGLFVSSSIGAYVTAKYADRIGNVWIKRLFTMIVLIMAIKLLI